MTKTYLEQIREKLANTKSDGMKAADFIDPDTLDVLAYSMLDWYTDKLDEATYTAEELA